MDRPRRGRPRSADTDHRIVAATLELLREHGPESVNVASVSARSGVARTTIYRRHRDREALLRAALTPVTSPGSPPADLPVPQKLVWVLERTREVLSGTIGLGGVAALLSERDPEFASALRSVLEAALEPIREQIEQDVATGRLCQHVDADLVLNLLLGSYLAEVLRHGTPRTDWLERTAALLLASLTPVP